LRYKTGLREEKYGISGKKAQNDIKGFIQELKSKKIIV